MFQIHLLFHFPLQVKIWSLPPGGRLTASLNASDSTLSREDKKIDVVQWHPAADNILAFSTQNSVKVFDVETSSQKYGRFFLPIAMPMGMYRETNAIRDHLACEVTKLIS